MTQLPTGRITLEDLARLPAPGTSAPTKVAFSSDGSYIAWLHSPDRSLRRQLFLYEVATGTARPLDVPAAGVDEADLSHEEKLRRERMRDLGQGVTSYSWEHDRNRLIVPLQHSVWAYEPESDRWVSVLELDGVTLIDPRVSPDGTKVAWVQDGELIKAVAGSNEPFALTKPAGECISHGLADFIAQEEMHRTRGYWWSDDSTKIAYTEVDESSVPEFRIMHHGASPLASEVHRYPFAGHDNPIVRLFVIEEDGKSDPVALDISDAEYLARVHWMPDGGVVAELQNRAQTELRLVRYDPMTAERTVLHTETSETWINLHDMFRPLRDGGYLWASERSGFQHLEVRNSDGSLRNVLTAGEWMVHDLVAVDQGTGRVWFIGDREDPTQRHLYSVSLQIPGPIDRHTEAAGTHRCAVSCKAGVFTDSFDSVEHQPEILLRSLADGDVEGVIFDEVDPRVAEMQLVAPQIKAVKNRNGTSLYCSVHVPDGQGPFPTVVEVYGGPGVQLVRDSFFRTGDLGSQYMREHGICVVTIDGRGSAGRGKDFEGAVHHNLGDLECQDQLDGIDAFVNEGLVDPERVAITGWSYGGYMAAMSLAKAPGRFKAAVAGAAVTHWDGYDTHYTERYMGTPDDNPAGYERSSVMSHVHGITGELLIVHGMLDENVHFRHSARLITSLIKEQIPYQLLLYPHERHGPRSPKDREHLEAQVMQFLFDSLEVGK